MIKKQTREKAVSFLNLGLTKELNQRLTAYCLKQMQRNGKIKHGLRTKIARQALKEWLDKHENDFNLEL